MPLNSDFPIQTLQEGSGVSLGVNPGSATYWLCDLGMVIFRILIFLCKTETMTALTAQSCYKD